MNEQKDYRLQIKIRNGPLLRLMEQKGIKTAAELSRASGVSQSDIGRFLNLTRPPTDKKGGWVKAVKTLSLFFCMPEEMLFPEQHINKALERNSFESDISLEELQGLSLVAPENNDTEVLELESKNLEAALDSINPREREILEYSFGINGKKVLSLDEIGEKYAVCGTRIMQIRRNALMKLRHPSRKLGPYLREEESHGD